MLSDEEYKAKKLPLVAERKKLEGKLTEAGQQIDNWMEEVEEKFDFAIHAPVTSLIQVLRMKKGKYLQQSVRT